MTIKRRRYDKESSQAAGLDYLLRRIDRLTTEPLTSAKATGGYTFTGPIEPTFLVASVDARSAIRDVADFVCDGVNDEEEIQYALDLLKFTGGCVVLSRGQFHMGNDVAAVTIVVHANVALVGRGEHVTQFVSDPLAAMFDFQITYTTNSKLADFSIIEVGFD